MNLHGRNIVAGEPSAEGTVVFQAKDPRKSRVLDPVFHEATPDEIDRALTAAEEAFEAYVNLSADQRAEFLERLAVEVEALGPVLIERAVLETGLPKTRLLGERGRTVNQLKMFAGVVREGSWVEARIDTAVPDRTPVPKPDIRRMLIPLGPCAVFGASNFPLAFSAAGGDSASALAAGCPIVLKAHPAHPGTSELVASAFLKAAEKTGMPPGVFSMVHGKSPRVSLELVRHPLTRAVGFTGSLRAGRALFDAAVSRPDPIPVYAEMGSINPVFLLPGSETESVAEGLFQSLTLGVGQFCTNPGVIVGVRSGGFESFLDKLQTLVADSEPGTMLHDGICQAYEEGIRKLENRKKVQVLARSRINPDPVRTQAPVVLFGTDARFFLENPQLREEVFGPSSLVVECRSVEEMGIVAAAVQGNLTATIHGAAEDLAANTELVETLKKRVGRLVFNGYPTGVEVCASMQHGGPYPATTDSRTTSVGTAAIQRFVRPVCYQNAPQDLLPPELRDENPRRIWRLVNNEWTREAVQP